MTIKVITAPARAYLLNVGIGEITKAVARDVRDGIAFDELAHMHG